ERRHILARVAVGRRKDRNEAVVDELPALGIAEPGTRQASGRWLRGTQGLHCRERARTRDPDHGDPGPARSRGAGEDGVGGRRWGQSGARRAAAQETGWDAGAATTL